MTYLLTGATGFIGRRLAALLLAGGHSVSYLGRKRNPSFDSRAAFFLWENPEKTLPPLETVPRTDSVIHLAGEPVAQRWTAEAKQRIRSSRVAGTRNLVAAIGRLKHKPKVLLSASAVGYYGNRGEEVLTEASGPGSGFLADVCVEWEREADLAMVLGLRVVHVRTGIVLGPGGGALGKMLKPFQFGMGGKLGDGRQWMPWIHRDDLARMFQFAAENATVSGAWNGAAPQPVTNAIFTKTLAGVLGRPALLPAPKFAIRLAFGEMGNVLFDSIRAVPAAPEKAGFSFEYRELEAALRAVLRKAA
ncbi:MAG: TIGR01777 family oxidoreductase [Bryobacteraceae bacterium]